MTRAAFVAGNPAAAGSAWLRTATTDDQERLRTWRNAAAAGFPRREPIDAAGQHRWFEGYLARDEDFLFLVMAGRKPCGCLGVRLAGGEWDVYNVIRGERTSGSRGFMGHGLDLLVAFARRRADLPVRAVVLAGNPAIAWYERHGFAAVPHRSDSVVMRWAGVPAGSATRA